MLKRTALLLGLALVINSKAYGADLREAVSYALNNGPDIQETILRKDIAEAELSAARESYYPVANVSGSMLYEQYSDDKRTIAKPEFLNRQKGKAAITQNIFRGFKDRNSILENMAIVKSANYKVESASENIALQVVNAYLDVLMYKEINRYAKETLAAHNKIYAQIEKRSESGISKVIDLDQARGRIASARTSLMAAQAELLDAETNFNRIVGIGATDLVIPSLASDAIPETQSTAVAVAMSKHPEVFAQSALITAAKAGYLKSRHKYFPTAELEASVIYDKNANGHKNVANLTYSGGVNVSFNLIEGGRGAEVQKAARELSLAREGRNKLYREIEQKVRYSWNSFTSSKSQLHYYEQHSNSSERVRDAYIKQFDLGQRTLLDLLDTENEFFQAKTSFLIAQYKELRGRYGLLNSMGTLLDTLNISVSE